MTKGLTSIREYANDVAVARAADVILYNGPVQEPADDSFLDLLDANPQRRKQLVLILVTYGGTSRCAYRIGRHIQRCYERTTVIVPGPCMSAGTLLATAASELAIGNRGALGPLDVQLYKPDEIGEFSSGLTTQQALLSLNDAAFDAFENTILQLKSRSRGQITARTAMEMAGKLTTGLFQQIYGQIDPVRLAEDYRSMRVAEEYGQRLCRKSASVKEGALGRLVAAYPAHGFVIDRDEANDLFNCVREPSEEEERLLRALGEYAHAPDSSKATQVYLSAPEEREEIHAERGSTDTKGGEPEESAAPENPEGGDPVQNPGRPADLGVPDAIDPAVLRELA